VLGFIDSYMVLVFFKTIFLVLVIGILHALILLPIVLHDTAPLTDKITKYWAGRQARRLQSGPRRKGQGEKTVVDDATHSRRGNKGRAPSGSSYLSYGR